MCLSFKNLRVNGIGVAERFFFLTGLASAKISNLTFQLLFKRQKKKKIVHYILFCKVNDRSGSL